MISAREKERSNAAKNRRELIAAGFTRRELVRMGLMTPAGWLVPARGLSARALRSDGVEDGQAHSPITQPFVEELSVMPIKQPVPEASLTPAPTAAPNHAGGEGRTRSHQAYDTAHPQKFYRIEQREAFVSISPDLNLQQTIDIGGGPFGMAFDGSNVWVSNFSRDAVSKIANAKVPPAMPQGLVLALGFSEPSGPSAFDASPAGNTGTITGATRTAGKPGYGNALSFNGVTDWVSVAPAASLDLVDAMTLEAWANPSTLTGGAAGWRTVILREQNRADLAYSLYANDGDANPSRPAGYVRIGFIDRPTAGGPALPVNTWSHLAATYDGTLLRLFVNGVLRSNVAVTGPIVTSSNPLRIGGNSIWGEYFKRLIDDVRIYNRPLTETEIRADMATPVP